MKRRRLMIGIALLTPTLLQAHTPFKQWTVYRRKHLLILTDKMQAGSFELGQQLAELLAHYLPDSKARVTRAPNTQRVASLLSTAQLDVALLSKATARALALGAEPFSDFGPIALRVLANHANFVLVARADFPDHHAYQIAETLQVRGAIAGFSLLSEATQQPPLHSGVTVFLRGAPQPEPPATVDSDQHPHLHQH